MNKRERVLAAIEGRAVDRVPSSYSLHFPDHKKNGQAAIDAHLDFFEATDTDILKIMNENLVPYMGDIKEAKDWKIIRDITLEDSFIKDQLKMTKEILAKCDQDAFKIGTLHGVIASGLHPIEEAYGYEAGRALQCTHLRVDKGPMLEAISKITDGLCLLAKGYLELGLDGIYYAALGGEEYYMTDQEYVTYILPYDRKILQTVKDNGGYNILHLCKDKLNLKRFQSCMDLVDVVNWGVGEDNISLEEGRDLFGDVTIMGGLQNREDVLIKGSNEEIRGAVKSIIRSFGKSKFIMGADCTLPTEIDYKRIATAVHGTIEN